MRYQDSANFAAAYVLSLVPKEDKDNFDAISNALSADVWNGPLYLSSVNDDATYTYHLPSGKSVNLGFYGDEGITDQWQASPEYDEAVEFMQKCLADSDLYVDPDCAYEAEGHYYGISEFEPEGYMMDCPDCYGTGNSQDSDDQVDEDGNFLAEEDIVDCPFCNGSGEVYVEAEAVYEVSAEDINAAIMGRETYQNVF